MPKVVEIPIPIRLDKLTEVMRIKGVSVYVHWTVFLIAAIILLGGLHRPVVGIVAMISYLAVILIHECGHLIAAQGMNCEVFSIKLYPILGLTCFQTPWSRFDHCVIAWAGVVAQAAVALPLVAWVSIFGYTPFEAVNAVLAILGFFSLGMAAFNLLPIRPLDGATAWGLIPELIKRVRGRTNTRSRGWR